MNQFRSLLIITIYYPEIWNSERRSTARTSPTLWFHGVA